MWSGVFASKSGDHIEVNMDFFLWKKRIYEVTLVILMIRFYLFLFETFISKFDVSSSAEQNFEVFQSLEK